MKSMIIAALSLLAAIHTAPASADTFLELHGLSYHFDRRWHQNEQNWGAGIEHDGWIAGYYRNSQDRNSVYAGYHWQPVAVGPVKLGVRLAYTTGYTFTKVVCGATITYDSQRYGVTAMLVPRVSEKHGGLVAINMRVRF